MGGAGTGNGGRAPFDEGLEAGRHPDSVHGQIDPKGRISVTTFRGLPRPGELTPAARHAIERARSDAQAPLETEVIPRRYRRGVQSYFDGLGGDGAAESPAGAGTTHPDDDE